MFTDVLDSLLPPRLVTELPTTVAVHRNAHPYEDAVILHLLNFDYDEGLDLVIPVDDPNVTVTVPQALQSGDLDVAYYELANLPAGQSLSYSRDGDEVTVTITPDVDNWGTLVIRSDE